MNNASVGKPVSRVDGRLKVTGAATYAAEFPVPHVAHAVLVRSSATRGRILDIDTRAAQSTPGVLAVLTHLNAPRLPYALKNGFTDPPTGEMLKMLQDDRVRFNGQPIAIVVAQALETAEHAASLVSARIQAAPSITRMQDNLAAAQEPTSEGNRAPAPRGDARGALERAEVRVDHFYDTPTHHHNPIGLLSTIAHWEDGERLTVYDTTQWVHNVRDQLAGVFGIEAADVRVVCPFTGGAFGCTLRMWPHVVAAAMAARVVNRPVKLALEREQMFTSNGYRPETRHRVALGAGRDGRLTSIIHEGWNSTSRYEEFTEAQIDATRFVYSCPNVDTPYRVVPLDVSTPTWMRAPGEMTGVFALESAMDELSYELNLDPLQLRLINYSERNEEKNQEWSSKELREAYRQGAERIGWSERKPQPRSMRDGDWLIGYGMATGSYPTNRSAATALARVYPDGTALVRSGSTDIGVGTYTAMTQIAADALGLPLDRVRFELGDSEMPHTPPQGGSQITASVGSAVHEASLAARAKILDLARADKDSPLFGARPEDVDVQDGRLFRRAEPARGETYAQILTRSNGRAAVEVSLESKPAPSREGSAQEGTTRAEQQYSAHAWGARFCVVRVHSRTGEVRVARFVNAVAAGRIVNLKQAESQLCGGTIMAIGAALMEETWMDTRYGRWVNQNLAEYHVPVHLDIPDIDTIFVPETDTRVNPLGVKGVGEIAAVGVIPAIANAVFHATGVRVRDLPITLDKLL